MWFHCFVLIQMVGLNILNALIMKQVVLNVPESEHRFFMKVIKNFPFVEVDEKKNKPLEMEA